MLIASRFSRVLFYSIDCGNMVLWKCPGYLMILRCPTASSLVAYGKHYGRKRRLYQGKFRFHMVRSCENLDEASIAQIECVYCVHCTGTARKFAGRVECLQTEQVTTDGTSCLGDTVKRWESESYNQHRALLTSSRHEQLETFAAMKKVS